MINFNRLYMNHFNERGLNIGLKFNKLVERVPKYANKDISVIITLISKYFKKMY